MKFSKNEITSIINNYKKNNENSPFIVEVLGTPNSGKTTAIQTFEKILKRSNIKYKIIYEVAGKCKIKNKLSPDFNIWTLNETLKQLIEIFNSNYDIVICERGLLDTLCWCDLFYRENKLSKEEHESITNYISLSRFIKNICYFYVMKCDVDVSLNRENLDELLDIRGSVVNEQVLSQYNLSLSNICQKYKESFNIEEIDTSKLTQTDINREFVCSVLNNISNKGI